MLGAKLGNPREVDGAVVIAAVEAIKIDVVIDEVTVIFASMIVIGSAYA